MLHFEKDQIENMEKIRRLNLVNSITGYKPANLIGSCSASGNQNLAIVSSVLHLSSSPAMIGFMQRPTTVPRHTYRNIRETGFYTINHVKTTFVAEAHYTSAKFPEDISEFDESGLQEEFLDGFPAPYVANSVIKIGLNYAEEYHIRASNTILVVGEIEHIYIPEDYLKQEGSADLDAAGTAVISGLNAYHSAQQIDAFPYARPGKFPGKV